MDVVRTVEVPPGEGRAVEVLAGQHWRLTAPEGEQVGDCTFLSLHNPREGYHAGQSVALNMLSGTGTMRRLGSLWSRPPYERVMLRVVEDRVGVHFAWNGGRCSTGVYAHREGIEVERTCQGNLAEAIAPWGLAADDVPDVFNAFMHTDVIDEAALVFRPSPAEPGDYIEMRAEIDVLAAVSACPSVTSASNGHRLKPLRMEVLQRRPGPGAGSED